MIKQIKLQNYRNLDRVEVFLQKGSNIIVAPNGSGKTNFLESIFFTIHGKSFKNFQSISEFVGPKYDFTISSITMEDTNFIECTTTKSIKSSRRILKLNGKTITSRDIVHKFPIIYFAPTSVDIINGEPSTRRDDIDSFLYIFNKKYGDTLEEYKTVVKNRNKILDNARKNNLNPEKEIEFWDHKLITLGVEIIKARLDFFRDIGDFIRDSINEIQFYLSDTNLTEFELSYLPNILLDGDIFNNYRLLLLENRNKEILLGKTLYGPHKDDFEFIVNKRNLRYFGSRGQQRIGVTLLKIAQIGYYQSKFNISPFLLLDDIMSELDNKNREKVFKFLSINNLDFVLTTADINELPKELVDRSNALNLIAFDN